MEPTFTFKSEVWLWNAQKGSWHFVSVPKKVSDDIKAFQEGPRHGFGSVRVKAAIGSTEWKTSIFPDSKRGVYVLPLKADVRKKEDVEKGKTITVTLTLQ